MEGAGTGGMDEATYSTCYFHSKHKLHSVKTRRSRSFVSASSYYEVLLRVKEIQFMRYPNIGMDEYLNRIVFAVNICVKLRRSRNGGIQ